MSIGDDMGALRCTVTAAGYRSDHRRFDGVILGTVQCTTSDGTAVWPLVVVSVGGLCARFSKSNGISSRLATIRSNGHDKHGSMA